VIAPFTALIETWLRGDVTLKGSVIYERLVAEHGFTGHYQRVKMHLATVRPRMETELFATDENDLRGLHRRFEVVPGAGPGRLGRGGRPAGPCRDRQDLHVPPGAVLLAGPVHLLHVLDGPGHVLGLPPQGVCALRWRSGLDRLRPHQDGHQAHVAPGKAVPLHPQAAAFAEHYGFVIDPLAAYRPTGKGRVERQVLIVREHVLSGRSFESLTDLDGTFAQWLVIRRAQVHRTHGEVISVRAERDRAALHPLPELPYLVTDRHLRRVGKDCLVAFEASLYSVPARRVRAGQRVEVRASPDTITLHALPGTTAGTAKDTTLLAAHARSAVRGTWVVDPTHWDGLPDGHTRSTTIDPPRRAGHTPPGTGGGRCRRTQPARGAADPQRRGGHPSRETGPGRLRRRRRPDRTRRQPPPPCHPHLWGPSMSTLTTTRIREHALKLGMTHLTDTISELVARAEADKMGYLDFVDLLLGEELGIREGRRFRNALKLSGLPHHKTLEDFDFTFQPDLEPRKVRDIASLEFVERHANVALLGPPGVGKTHLASALAVAACQAGYSVYFTSLDDMVRKLKIAEATGRFNRQLTSYLRPAVLVVDEVGYLPLDRAEANMVFQLVSRRYERGSMIITSNKSFAEWGQVLGDDVLATAILDRLLHHCDVLSINGPSYRLKDRLTLVPGGEPMP